MLKVVPGDGTGPSDEVVSEHHPPPPAATLQGEVGRSVCRSKHLGVIDRQLELDGRVVVGIASHDGLVTDVGPPEPANACGGAEGEAWLVPAEVAFASIAETSILSPAAPPAPWNAVARSPAAIVSRAPCMESPRAKTKISLPTPPTTLSAAPPPMIRSARAHAAKLVRRRSGGGVLDEDEALAGKGLAGKARRSTRQVEVHRGGVGGVERRVDAIAVVHVIGRSAPVEGVVTDTAEVRIRATAAAEAVTAAVAVEAVRCGASDEDVVGGAGLCILDGDDHLRRE
jgi:hypothetical protein